MAENSKIEWTDHTFNPWRGCTKVSPGCANCYAETLSKRNPKVLGRWGDQGTRVIAAESYWRQPIKWNRQAAIAEQVYEHYCLAGYGTSPGEPERPRVFCASLADVLEDRPELVAPRMRLFDLMRVCENLDWLLLTKRPENFQKMLPWSYFVGGEGSPTTEHAARPWPNVWLGVSVEDQARRDRIDILRTVPAAVRFLSLEPLLEDLGTLDLSGVHWVICGGESGSGARPMHPAWVRSLRDQCQAASVPFFFKQWGEWVQGYAEPGGDLGGDFRRGNATILAADGSDNDGYFRRARGDVILRRVGKAAAGRLLDGREWSEFPECVEAEQR